MCPDVSVIIPFYNAANYLRQAIDSALKQDFGNYEIILVNDGSTDEYQKILDDFSSNNKIIVINQKNLGLRRAVKTGLMHAHGTYTMFLDADDWYKETMISTLYQIAKETNADCVLGGYLKCTEIKQEIVLPINSAIFSGDEINQKILNPFFEKDGNIYRRWSAPRWDKLYRTELLKQVYEELNYDIVAGEDLEMNLRYLSKCQKIVSASNAYHYCYRCLDNSMSHHYTQKMNDKYRLLETEIRKLSDELNMNGNGILAFEDNCTVNMLTELEQSADISKEDKKRIRTQLVHSMHNRGSLMKTVLQKDFPLKSSLQKFYRKIHR